MNRRAKLELKSLLTPTRFMQAWEHVRQCGPSPGIDDIGFNEFERDLKQHIEQLVQELESGQYQPDAVRRCEILQLSGKVRPLAIPTVRDRLLLRLLSEALTPLIEPRLKQGCFAFRPGRSAVQAAAEVSARIRDGWVHVARFDISSFFDSIPRDLVYGSIKKLNIDGAFFQLLAQLIETPVFGPAGYEDAGGLHQGSALSPLLSNLVLTPFDGIMEEIPIIYIRYCDDIICLARDPATLIRATETARAELSRLQLQFNEKKFWTGLADEGFVFLGFQFNADGRGPANRAIETVMTRFGQILSAAPAAAGIGSQLAQCLRSWGVYYGCNAADFLDSSQPIVLLAQYLAAETVGERESVRESLLTLDTPESKTETRCLAELAGILFTDFPVLAALTFYNALTGPETPGLARLAGIPAQTRQLGKNYGSSASIEDLANALDGLGQFDWAQACERAAAFLYFVEREDEGEELDGEELDGEELDDEKLDDEKLAGSELNGDEVEAGHVDRVMEQTAKKATRANSAHKNSGATADRSQLEQFRQIFQGAEAQFLQITAATEAQGSIQWQHHMRPISLSDVQAHLSGEAGIAVVPLRSDGRVRIAVIDIDVSKQAILNNNNIVDPEDYSVAHKDAIQLISAAESLGLNAILERTGGRGWHVWILFDRPVQSMLVRKLLKLICVNAGPAPDHITRELLPERDRRSPTRAGRTMTLPLGLHRQSRERSALIIDGRKVHDLETCLQSIKLNPGDRVTEILEQQTRALAREPKALKIVAGDPLQTGAVGEVITGCGVVKALINKASETRYLNHRERAFLLSALGNLPNGMKAIETAMKLTMNYDQSVTRRQFKKLKPAPISCPRTQEIFADLANQHCHCKFSLPTGLYPTPVLHSRSWAHIGYLKERHEAANRAGSRQEKRVKKVLEEHGVVESEIQSWIDQFLQARREQRKARRKAEKALDKISQWMDEQGVDSYEIPEGTLRRSEQDGDVQWSIEL